MKNLRSFEKKINVGTEVLTLKNEKLEPQAYIEFLTRTDLGRQYPKEDFLNRIASLLQNVPISLGLRNAENSIVGICFGLTDFAYWLFLTDLGIDKTYERKGLGKRLVEGAHELAGGEERIIQYACIADNALPFYSKVGMEQATDVMVKDKMAWTSFDVKQEFA